MRVHLSFDINPETTNLGRVMEDVRSAITHFESQHNCLHSRHWNVSIVDDHDLTRSVPVGDYTHMVIGALFITENHPYSITQPFVVVSTAEDVYERTTELLNQMFGKQ